MSVERMLISARFGERVYALQSLVNATVERKVTLKGAMAKIRGLLESGRSINWSDHSVKVSKLTREAQLLSGLAV